MMEGQRGKEVSEALLNPRRILPAHLLLPEGRDSSLFWFTADLIWQ
jgi:hypothetical protein